MKTMEWNGQALSYLWKDGEGEKPSGLVICLAAGEEDAKACAQALEPQVGTAAPGCGERPGDKFLGERRGRSGLFLAAGCRAGQMPAGSHWFRGQRQRGVAACLSLSPVVFWGCGGGRLRDPYQARNLKDVPLLVAASCSGKHLHPGGAGFWPAPLSPWRACGAAGGVPYPAGGGV